MIFDFIIKLNLVRSSMRTLFLKFPSDETIYSVGKTSSKLRVVAKKPNEAAKMFGMYLLHAGVLNEYSKGNKTVIISVFTTNLLVDFKAWYSHKESYAGSNTFNINVCCQ